MVMSPTLLRFATLRDETDNLAHRGYACDQEVDEAASLCGEQTVWREKRNHPSRHHPGCILLNGAPFRAGCMRMMRASVPTTRSATRSMAGWILILRIRYRDIRSIPARVLPSRQPRSRGVAVYLQYLPVRTEPLSPLCAV